MKNLTYALCLLCALSTPTSLLAMGRMVPVESHVSDAMTMQHEDCTGTMAMESMSADHEGMNHLQCHSHCPCCQGAFSSMAPLVLPLAQSMIQSDMETRNTILLPDFLSVERLEKPPKFA